MIYYLNDAAQLWLDGPDSTFSKILCDTLKTDILPVIGHYRLERFDQRLLEDFRQRVSRRGVSLCRFRDTLLPSLHAVLGCAVEHGWLTAVPPLCHYTTPPLILKAQAKAWLTSCEKTHSPQTVARYRSILTYALLPSMGKEDLSLLDSARLEQYRQSLPNEVGESAFKQHLAVLYGILDHAIGQTFHFRSFLPKTPPRPLLSETATLWLVDAQTRFSARTMEEYHSILQKYMLPFLGTQTLNKLSVRKLEDYRRAIQRKGVSATTYTKHLAVINGILQYALDQGLISQLPEIRATYPKPSEAICLPGEDVMRGLLDADHELPSSLIVRLAWQMGLSRQEIQALRWDNLDLDKRTAQLQDREVPVPEDLCASLRDAGQQTGTLGHVLRSVRGKILSPEGVSIEAKKCLSRHGLDEIRLADLRHSYIIRLLQNEPPQVVAARCGFKNPEDVIRLYRGYLP